MKIAAATLVFSLLVSACAGSPVTQHEAEGMKPMKTSPLRAIRHLDYTVIYARDLPAMKAFYQDVMGFELQRELGDSWIEFRIGASVLALTKRGVVFDDPAPPRGALSVQLAFRVAPREVDACAQALRDANVKIEREPTDQAWGHRTVFFRDPDGNVLEIYAEI